MRVISLVPSLTETLIECGVDVVGRTRFCIHPNARVASIPKVGGTKGIDWQRCEALKPDLVLFDREENVRAMAAECPFPWTSTHIQSIEACVSEFKAISKDLNSAKLAEQAKQWQQVVDAPPLPHVDWANIPGSQQNLEANVDEIKSIEYMIWKDPWMAVGQETFIYSVLGKLGFSAFLPEHSAKYPQLSDSEMARPGVYHLFSSEPYRFMRYQDELNRLNFRGAIVDGELYSWFGIRSLRALQKYLNLS